MEAVRRNEPRFPSDLMFQLGSEKARNLRSQFATSSSGGYDGRRYLPDAFTECGVALRSTILSSPPAIAANTLTRTLVQLLLPQRQYATIRQNVGELSQRVQSHDEEPQRPRASRTSENRALGLLRLLAVLVERGQPRWRVEPLQVVIRMSV